jgi:hypothetical protein
MNDTALRKLYDELRRDGTDKKGSLVCEGPLEFWITNDVCRETHSLRQVNPSHCNAVHATANHTANM